MTHNGETSQHLLIENERQRRRNILGDIPKLITQGGKSADSPGVTKKLRGLAHKTQIPFRHLRQWLTDECTNQLPGGWSESNLSALELSQVSQQAEQLMPYADQIHITSDEIDNLAQKNQCSSRTIKRKLFRYRVNGLLGFLPRFNPETKRHRGQATQMALGSLNEKQISKVLEKYEIIKPLEHLQHLTNEQVTKRAAETGRSERYIRQIWKLFSTNGLNGLTPAAARSDKGRSQLDDDVVEWIKGIFFNKPRIAISAACNEIAEICKAHGKLEPTYRQVKAIHDNLNPIDKALTKNDKGKEYRNTIRPSGRFPDTGKTVFQVDASLANVMIKDLRHHTKQTQIRPQHLKVIEEKTSAVLGSIFYYDVPDQYDLGLLLRDVFIKYGCPDEIKVDQGKIMVAQYIKSVLQLLDVELVDLAPHYPEGKGKIERTFRTDDDNFYSGLEGYTGANVHERLGHITTKYTISEISEKYKAYSQRINDEIFDEKSDETRLTYFQTHRPTSLITDLRELDLMLMPTENRTFGRSGIEYKHRIYWAPKLAKEYMQQTVQVRSPSAYSAPDELIVFSVTGEFIATALADDTVEGNELRRREITSAQKSQRSSSRERTNKSKAAFTKAKLQADKLQAPKKNEAETPPESNASGPDPRNYKPKRRPKNQSGWDAFRSNPSEEK